MHQPGNFWEQQTCAGVGGVQLGTGMERFGAGRLVGRIMKDQTLESELDSNSELHGTLPREVPFMVPEHMHFTQYLWDTLGHPIAVESPLDMGTHPGGL